ncbi:helix-turn-helix domain-containing protein [Cellulomonas iranensis]|uniref:helix-turn-helix domain-containing protein n=1 Tax=Cellulomonas iranensis TaxID=76862 RepID=UPI003D7CD023
MDLTPKQVLEARSRSELIEAATALASADMKLRRALVEARRAAGLSQQDVATALGIKQPSVAAFERYDSDPRLSTIRRYAVAVGAQVEHRVVEFDFGREFRSVSSVTRAGVTGRPAPVPIAVAADSKRLDFTLAA